ncbi:MAG: diamine N-acetyltransferase [Verrucomicrobiota bacterium]|jgi:ribosomal protein S18 acetylase RimI-like enzyme
MMCIVPATATDIPALQHLAHRIWHEYYPGIISRAQIDYMLARMYAPETIARELSNGVRWEIVRWSGESVGFLSFEFIDAPPHLKLHKLYLLPALHGQGIGRDMLEHVKTQCSNRGASEIWLQVNQHNTRALRAYQRAGFQIRNQVVTDIGHGFVMDDFIMTLGVPKGSVPTI